MSPNVTVHGRIIDSYTGENLLYLARRLGYSYLGKNLDSIGTRRNQTLSVKQDGSYNNSKLFEGTYDMLPYGGPFWPVDTVA